MHLDGSVHLEMWLGKPITVVPWQVEHFSVEQLSYFEDSVLKSIILQNFEKKSIVFPHKVLFIEKI
jgi:hypothetical protein